MSGGLPLWHPAVHPSPPSLSAPTTNFRFYDEPPRKHRQQSPHSNSPQHYHNNFQRNSQNKRYIDDGNYYQTITPNHRWATRQTRTVTVPPAVAVDMTKLDVSTESSVDIELRLSRMTQAALERAFTGSLQEKMTPAEVMMVDATIGERLRAATKDSANIAAIKRRSEESDAWSIPRVERLLSFLTSQLKQLGFTEAAMVLQELGDAELNIQTMRPVDLNARFLSTAIEESVLGEFSPRRLIREGNDIRVLTLDDQSGNSGDSNESHEPSGQGHLPYVDGGELPRDSGGSST